MIRQEKSQVRWDQVSAAVFSGLKYTYSMALMAIILLALLYTAGWDWASYDQTVYEYISYAAIVLGSFIAGHKLKARGWLVGAILAVIYWLVTLTIIKVFGLHPIDLNVGLIRILIAGLLGTVGGIMGVNL